MAPDAVVVPSPGPVTATAEPTPQDPAILARIELALQELRAMDARLGRSMRRIALFTGLAGGAAVALVGISAGMWLRSAAGLAAAADVQTAAAAALGDRIVRLDAAEGRITLALQETTGAGTAMLERMNALQAQVEAEAGTVRQGLRPEGRRHHCVRGVDGCAGNTRAGRHRGCRHRGCRPACHGASAARGGAGACRSGGAAGNGCCCRRARGNGSTGHHRPPARHRAAPRTDQKPRPPKPNPYTYP